MAENKPKTENNQTETWTLDQIGRSAFFHRKLHEWQLLEMAEEIGQVRGENLEWDNLQISDQAWDKVIHRGIKPVGVFAHPHTLRTIRSSTAYYRMLALVSQKSMQRVGLSVRRYETGRIPNEGTAVAIAQHLNRIISYLVEADENINEREFDLWRGMAAGSQAQGSWQNNKGSKAEKVIREIILRRLQETEIIIGEQANAPSIELDKHRILMFAGDPDIAVYANGIPQVAVEIKGGIDQAGVLERIRQENLNSVTVLIMPDVSMTRRTLADLSLSEATVSYQFSTSAIVEDEDERERFFQILGI